MFAKTFHPWSSIAAVIFAVLVVSVSTMCSLSAQKCSTNIAHYASSEPSPDGTAWQTDIEVEYLPIERSKRN